MRLTRLKIDRTGGTGSLLDGLEVFMGRPEKTNEPLTPLCLIGPNGSGKSQFLQLLAEIFQTAWHEHRPEEEHNSSNSDALFELEYSIRPERDANPVDVRLRRRTTGKAAGPITLEIQSYNGWSEIASKSEAFGRHLPSLIVGYTSGDNETLSLPFLVSRAGYADAVARAALSTRQSLRPRDNRLLLIDYGTNLEVLFANLILNSADARRAILEHARLTDISSCRCIIRLAHSAAPKAPRSSRKSKRRKGIQLTNELESILKRLKQSATCWHEDIKTETYVFDYFVDDATRDAFRHFFSNALSLYRSLHKFALLNDLAIPRAARLRMNKAVRERRFASRLPEPQQEDLVFGFEEVSFHAAVKANGAETVDYVALSDGEHQQAMILGLFSMITQHNALFILDEPESHFNPQWRIEFTKRLLDLPVRRGEQDVLLTSHAPFVPADLPREQVLIFSRDKNNKVSVANPQIETFGANFDRIIEHCFDVRPPISQLARDEIKELRESDDIDKLEEAMPRLGSSVEKSFVADRLRQLKLKQVQ